MSGDLHAALRELSASVARLEEKAARAAEGREIMCRELHQINTKLDEIERLRQRGWGILAGVALTGGGFGAGISKLLGN